jgi:two-component system, NarL family, nitrate/nitrite response regulator NarL
MINESRAIRLVIADEQPFVRHSLCQLLGSDADLLVLGEASNASGATHLVRQLRPDILLVDLDLSRGLELQALCSPAGSPPLRIVAMVNALQKPHIVEAFLLGAHGIVLKTSSPMVLLKSIRSVMAGQYWLEHESVGLLVEALREVVSHKNEQPRPKDYGLTRRELEIIKKIVNGHSNKEVGVEFSISERTVKHHLTNIFGKIGVTSRLQLALFAVNHQLMVHQTPALLLQSMQSEQEA